MKALLTTCALAVFAVPAFAGPSGLHVVNTLKIGGTGGWDYAAFDSVTGKVFLSHGTSIASVDPATGKVNAHLADADGAHIALPLGDGKTLLVTQGKSSKATFIDAETGANLGDIPTAAKPDGAILDPATGKVFVLDNGGAQLDVLDPKTRTAVGKVALTGAPEGFAADGKGLIFVHYEDKQQIAVIDTRALKVKAVYDIKDCDGPTGIAFVPEQRLLLSACDGGVARVTNADTGAEVATLAIGDRPDSAFYDDNAKLGYIPSGDGKLAVIAFDGRPHVVELVATKAGARTGAVDPKTGRVYLPTADFAPAKPGERPQALPDTFEVLVLGK
jgi:DNA-binding beta-propeller fold protein YncE